MAKLKSKLLTDQEFVDKFSGAPWDEDRLLEALVSKLHSQSELRQLANKILNYKTELFNLLEELGYEQG